ncbi:unnamed protein product [Prorocentrum cordatum]|uniref:FAD-binding domain-containing protein n=1 Tax=Prorocentrum cordatum TaxID=2364126 RepID=A0ABN9PWN2_9DINO|nr:unnamed protein product [Polarella glacialis]
MPRAPSTVAPAAESRPAASRLRVAVAGAGPGGLGCAIGLARQGHEIHVFERLDAPAVRGLVSRGRSYPVAVEARGMRALERLGAASPHSAVRRHMPQRQDFSFDALIGSRDALVQGLLEHIEESQPTWPGSVHIYHCCGVAGVDLSRRTLEFAPGAAAPGVEAAARAAPFDLICACDGRNSPVRESAVLQVADLQVSHHEDWTRYKTVTLDHPRGLTPGRMHFLDGVHVAVLPDGTAVGRIGMKGAGKGSGAGQLRRMGLNGLMPYVSAEEEAAFDSRRINSEGGGANASRLVAGGCLALVGDAATSYVESHGGHGGANHALEMAASLAEALTAQGGADLAEVLRAWSEARMPDELAYARGQLGGPADTSPYRELSAKGKGKGKGMGGKGKVDGKSVHGSGAAHAHPTPEPGNRELEPHSWGQKGWSEGVGAGWKGKNGKGKVDGKAGHVAGAAYAHDAVEPSKKDLDPQSWGQRGWSAGWKGKDKGNDKGKGWWGGS